MDKKPAVVPTVNKKIIQLPGAFDVVAGADPLWGQLLATLERYVKEYGFTRFEAPLLEDAQLYSTVFGGTDERFLQLLTMEAGGRTAAVRSSILPSLLRVLAYTRGSDQNMVKWFYHGQVARRGPKQLQSDYEFGLEVWGNFNHLTEAQVLGAVWRCFVAVGLPDVTFEISSCGSLSCQEQYAHVLREFLKGKRYELCDACTDKLVDRPLEVLRCQQIDCQAVVSEAPTILDYLDDVSRKQFTNLLEALEELRIPYQLNPLLMGFDGAVGTLCSLKLKVGGSMAVVVEGSGHSGLLQRLGGKPAPAFGLSGSLRLLHQALVERAVVPAEARKRPAEVYLVPLGELAAKRSLRLFSDLVESGVIVFDHFGYVGVKNQLKTAQEAGSPIALIMGQKEAVDEVVILRDVKSGMQEVFSYDKIVSEVRKRLGH